MRLDNLRKARLQKKMTQADVAARVGTSQGRVSTVELGLPVRSATGARFAKALGCRLEDLQG